MTIDARSESDGSSPTTPSEPATLAALLAPAAVDFATLDRRYRALLELVRRLIGVVPNCDPLLEIWPPGFRTYNLMVPNFINLPLLLLDRGAPKHVVGLAMYASSRASGCAYCSAHTCSFALRRGALPEQVANALDPGGSHSPAERAAIVAAAALSQLPSTFRAEHRTELERHFSPADVEWIALSVAMMGFLNKFMDAVGVELEEPTVAEVEALIAPSGWTPGKHRAGTEPPPPVTPPRADTLRTTLGVLRHGPSAMRLDRRWTAGVPTGWPEAGEFLRRETGHNFPLLGRLRHGRPRRALATMLRDNLAAADSHLGLQTKHLAGLVYATIAGNETLVAEARALARHEGVSEATLAGVASFAAARGADASGAEASSAQAAAAPASDAGASRAAGAQPPADLDDSAAAALLLARAAAPSPAQVDPAVISHVREHLAPAAIVELLVWISLQQLLHRLSVFFEASDTEARAV